MLAGSSLFGMELYEHTSLEVTRDLIDTGSSLTEARVVHEFELCVGSCMLEDVVFNVVLSDVVLLVDRRLGRSRGKASQPCCDKKSCKLHSAGTLCEVLVK